VRLVDAASGADVDRATFKQAAGSELALRDSLAQKVAEFLRKRIGNEVQLRESRAGTANTQAWLLVRRGGKARQQADSLWAEDAAETALKTFAAADSLFAAAEALDPAYQEPTVQRAALAYRRSRIASDRQETDRWSARAIAEADRVLQRDSRNADALEIRGTARYFRFLTDLTPADKKEALLANAEQDLTTAVGLKPSLAGAWSALGHLYGYKGNTVEAKLAATRAYEEDAYLSNAADVLSRLHSTSYELEQFTDAQRWCAEGTRRFPRDPRFLECQLRIMTTRAAEPDVPRAWKLADSIARTAPAAEREYQRRIWQIYVAAVLGRVQLPDSARRVLERARATPEVDPDGDLMAEEAFVRLQLGEKDEAIRLLTRYLSMHPDHREGFSKDVSWWWRDLRDDPRFKALIGSAR
jgi:hypothetical protein